MRAFFRRIFGGDAATGLEADAASAAIWRVTGVSETGAGHLRSATPCQDAHAFQMVDQGWLALAVADGAGSAKQSEAGARAAVEAAVRELVASLPPPRVPWRPEERIVEAPRPSRGELLRGALAAARRAVEDEATKRAVASRELACTLIVAVLGPHSVAAAGVGDGGLVVEHPGGRLETLLRPDGGEFEGETTFLTGRGALEGAHFAELEVAVESLAAFTDGLQGLVLHRKGWLPHPGFFAKVFDPLRHEENPAAAGEAVRRMLRSDAVRSRTHDDVTLVVASRTADWHRTLCGDRTDH
jgi:hypothetical protein